jgi:phosphoenolpyruvate carboxylase
VAELLSLIERAQQASDQDPFGNPVLSVALAIARRMDDGHLDDDSLQKVVCHLRDAAFADRARRLAAYVGGTGRMENEAALRRVAGVVLRPDPADSPVRWAQFRDAVQRPRYAAVFTAHPTFALPAKVGEALAAMASGAPAACFPSHRPQNITLEGEFTQACAAISRGRDALDAFSSALLAGARDSWPDRWTELAPRPLILASWVGYDTDGRTDIGWLDIIRLRLRMKRLQLQRLAAQLEVLPHATPIGARLAIAREALDAQI